MNWRLVLPIAIAIPLLFCSDANAQQLRKQIIERFDKDGDGKLSASERRAALDEVLKRRNPDGRLPEQLSWTINGLEREALVYLPQGGNGKPAPVVFGFHGHGGSAVNADRSFALQNHWPEAIVVYMQGIPTPGKLTDPEGKRNGWQHDLGEQNDRDLDFFDAVLKTLRERFKVDNTRIYSTGHSNGGAFTYLLWVARGDVFAAIAPSAAGSRALRSKPPKPKPVMHIAGEKDALVKFSWQELTMAAIRKLNNCDSDGTDWAKDCTLFTSSLDSPVVTMIHSGTHKYPKEAPALIVRFFKEHQLGRQ